MSSRVLTARCGRSTMGVRRRVEYLVARSRCNGAGIERRRRAPLACSERLPPGPPRPTRHAAHGTRHAPPSAHHAPAPPSRLPAARSPPRSYHHTIVSMFFVKYDQTLEVQDCHGGVGTHRAARGAGPARCVTHLSRSFLACSRSPPSAETCRVESASPPPPAPPDIATVLMPSTGGSRHITAANHINNKTSNYVFLSHLSVSTVYYLGSYTKYPLVS